MDRDTHEYFFKHNQKMVEILRQEVDTIQGIIDTHPSWLVLDVKLKTKIRVTREHLAEHQKDMVIHGEALKR